MRQRGKAEEKEGGGFELERGGDGGTDWFAAEFQTGYFQYINMKVYKKKKKKEERKGKRWKEKSKQNRTHHKIDCLAKEPTDA